MASPKINDRSVNSEIKHQIRTCCWHTCSTATVRCQRNTWTAYTQTKNQSNLEEIRVVRETIKFSKSIDVQTGEMKKCKRRTKAKWERETDRQVRGTGLKVSLTKVTVSIRRQPTESRKLQGDWHVGFYGPEEISSQHVDIFPFDRLSRGVHSGHVSDDHD